MRRTFPPPTSLALGLVTFLPGDIAGAAQTRVDTRSSFFIGSNITGYEGLDLIVGVASLIIFQALLIVWLLINRNRRQKAEEASRASELRYRNVVETQTELICRFLPDTTLTFVNDAYCRHFGQTRDQLIGTRFIQLIPEHLREATLSQVASLIENPRAEVYEHEVVLPNGGRGWQQWVDNVVGSSNGHGVELQGIGRDVTERRQAEEALRSIETRFQILADSAPLLIWMSGPNNLCTYVNQSWQEFTGRTIEQELGHGWTEGIFSDDYERCWEIYNWKSERREPFKLEYRLRRADGVFRWLYVSAAPRFDEAGEFRGISVPASISQTAKSPKKPCKKHTRK